MRIYIGVFPEIHKLPLLDEIYQSLNGFEDHIQFSPRDQLHFSLAFLGNDITATQATEIEHNLRQSLQNIPPFEYSLSHLALNYPMHIQPAWVMYFIKKSESLQALYLETIKACRQAGATPITTYDFLPHITIAKIKSPLPTEITEKLYSLHNQFASSTTFTLSEVKIVESTLSPEGSIYNPLATIQLG